VKLAALFAAISVVAAGQDAQLAEARARILQAIRNLPRYTCTETIDRSRFVDADGPARRASCDQLLANRHNGMAKPELTETDRIRLDVLNSDEGVEVYSWPGAGRTSIERVQDLAGEGDIGTGAFGPFLINIFSSEGVQFIPEGTVENLLQYRYRVPEKSSHYRVEAAGKVRIVPYDGRFWLDPATLDLRRLTVRTGELTATTGHCEATTTIDFARTHIGANDYLLPRETLLETLRRDAAKSRNTTRYGACREFTGESTIRFDATADEVMETGPATGTHFPSGVRFTVALLDDLDTATAAGGDAISVRVVKSSSAILPAGAIVHGRLMRLSHHLTSEPGFSIAIAFERVGVRPFAAVPDRAMVLPETTIVQRSPNSVHTWATGRRASPRGGTFVFPSSKATIVIPRGTTSEWITVAPPK
jgi:hypothetical protein